MRSELTVASQQYARESRSPLLSGLRSGRLPFFVYVIESQTTGRRYVGHTGDLDRRVAEHNNAAHNPRKYTTKQTGPWNLVHHEVFATRAQAMRRERWLKSGQGRRWIDQLMERASPAERE